nr:MAG TPA: hypothetical protein [Bacteriophage sp.]
MRYRNRVGDKHAGNPGCFFILKIARHGVKLPT